MPELTPIFCHRCQRSTFNAQRSTFNVLTPNSSLLTPDSARNRAAFTVIELLVVIGVLSVLLSILLPVFHNAHTATLRARARIQATALAQAVIQYKNVYGYWPGMMTDNGGNIQRNSSVFTYTDLNTPLVCRGSNEWFEIRQDSLASTKVNKIPKGDNTLYRSLLPFDTRYAGNKNRNPLNPNRIRFIELKAEETPLAASYPDPWNKEFCVVMGLDPTRLTTLRDSEKDTDIISFSNHTAVAVSRQIATQYTTFYFLSAGITNGVIRRANP